MDKEELILFLKENIRIEYEETGGLYGSAIIKQIKIYLCDEEITNCYLGD